MFAFDVLDLVFQYQVLIGWEGRLRNKLFLCHVGCKNLNPVNLNREHKYACILSALTKIKLFSKRLQMPA